MTIYSKIKMIAFLSAFFSGFLSVQAFSASFFEGSSGRDVAFAFYKTAQSVPDYERWIRLSEPYLSTPQAKSKAVIEEQKVKLNTDFMNYSPKSNPITIKADVLLSLNYPQNPDSDPLILTFEFEDIDDTNDLFFPFDYAGDHFGVIIDQLEMHMRAELPARQRSFITSHMGPKKRANAVIQVIPVQADITQPYEKNGTEYWLLATEVASLTIWSDQEALLYDYSAPWYMSPVENSIGELKSKQEEIEEKLNITLDPILLPVDGR